MDTPQLIERFFQVITPDLPNEWDVEEAVEGLAELSPQVLDAVFEQVQVIWPVSNSLCFSYMTQVGMALGCIDPTQLPLWVNETLDLYESSGLKAAQRYMMDVQGHFVCRLQGQSGVRFNQVAGPLLHYARGLAGGYLELAEAHYAGTDGMTIFLPGELSVFAGEEDNAVLYKLLVSMQWGYCRLGSFLVNDSKSQVNPSENGSLWLADYIAARQNPELFATLYLGLETLRIRKFLDDELPGLMREVQPLLARLTCVEAGDGAVTAFISGLQQAIFYQESSLAIALLHQVNGLNSAEESLALAREVYDDLQAKDDDHAHVAWLPCQGKMLLERFAGTMMSQRQQRESLFVAALTTLLLQQPVASDNKTDNRDAAALDNNQVPPEENGAALVLPDRPLSEAGIKREDQVSQFVTINNERLELTEELAELASEIRRDLGRIPASYISSAEGKAGQGNPAAYGGQPSEGAAALAPVTYDEWDYRRAGFRRDWCSVTEKEIPLIKSNFIASTLAGYHGQIIRLRHQFEMMRTTERFVRRQRDGDDIDIDAMVEALADTLAGQQPSDRLFIRLERDERDIAVMFLVDMSNSTRGWVGQGIKESLVLLCEALETLGDRYGIYGFSGMRRLRCEVFPIKGLEESYTAVVQDRIASIAPREYTRMAPAIRHMTSLLQDVDARVRLLITLSDGKPEDYDDYKGEYAIEDTRHALIEAKMAGIHPFCITIDQHAHEYMAHMYGEVNYIFIDNVRKLPGRMPEIYRVLTS